jgi:hypothetical protein
LMNRRAEPAKIKQMFGNDSPPRITSNRIR